MTDHAHGISIANRRIELDQTRREYSKQVMESYDKDVFNPARQALMKECADAGHARRVSLENNGLGWHWYRCSACGVRLEITGPEGERHSDDIT